MCNTHYSARAGHERATYWQVLSQIRPRRRHGYRVVFLLDNNIHICVYNIFIYVYIYVQQDRNHGNKHDNREIKERDSVFCVRLLRAECVCVCVCVQSQCVLHRGNPQCV